MARSLPRTAGFIMMALPAIVGSMPPGFYELAVFGLAQTVFSDIPHRSVYIYQFMATSRRAPADRRQGHGGALSE